MDGARGKGGDRRNISQARATSCTISSRPDSPTLYESSHGASPPRQGQPLSDVGSGTPRYGGAARSFVCINKSGHRGGA
eukprot:16244118-Heterocapsa_arctica.AAC.1